MKTNVEMIRKMGDFDVVQRSKDGMFNATALLKQWNSATNMQKQISHFSENEATEIFINALVTKGICKERNHVIIKKRGKNGGTWMTPLLFLDFSMWLDPTFKVDVLQFVYDNLIAFRNQAGDNWKPLCKAFASLNCNDFASLAEALNYVVFNKHSKDIRNTATVDEIADMTALQLKYCDIINDGYIKTKDTLFKALRREWGNRHGKAPSILS